MPSRASVLSCPDVMVETAPSIEPAYVETSILHRTRAKRHGGAKDISETQSQGVMLDLRSRRLQQQDSISARVAKLSISQSSLATYKSSRRLPSLQPAASSNAKQKDIEMPMAKRMTANWVEAIDRMDQAIAQFLEAKPTSTVRPSDKGCQEGHKTQRPWFTHAQLPPIPERLKELPASKAKTEDSEVSDRIAFSMQSRSKVLRRKSVPSIAEAEKQPATPSQAYERFIRPHV